MAGVWVWFFVVIGAIVAFSLLGLVIFLWLKSYDYKVRIREITSGKVRLIHDTTAKVTKDNENIHLLKLFTKKGIHHELPLPPKESVDYDPGKKKKIVEVWYSDDTGYVFVKDESEIEGFKPFTTNQRLQFVNQLKKKSARKKESWTQYIPLMTSGLILVLVLAVLLIFWGQAIQPTLELGANYNSLLDKTDQILEKAILLEGGGQVISSPPPI